MKVALIVEPTKARKERGPGIFIPGPLKLEHENLSKFWNRRRDPHTNSCFKTVATNRIDDNPSAARAIAVVICSQFYIILATRSDGQWVSHDVIATGTSTLNIYLDRVKVQVKAVKHRASPLFTCNKLCI